MSEDESGADAPESKPSVDAAEAAASGQGDASSVAPEEAARVAEMEAAAQAKPPPPDFSQWTPRIEDIDQERLVERFEIVSDYFTKHVDPLDYRNFDAYVDRANIGFALGAPAIALADDLYHAARCIHQRQDLHLTRTHRKKFLTRRVLPVELAMMTGQPQMTLEMSIQYGLPTTLLLAREAPGDVFDETKLLTSYFQRGSCTSHRDLAGLGAVIYAGAAAAIGRGFDDEALLALNVFQEASKPFESMPAGKAAPTLRRYDMLCTALGLLITGRYQELAMLCDELIRFWHADQERKIGDEWVRPSKPQKWLDTGVAGILAMAALRQVVVPLDPKGPAHRYRDFVAFFTTAPARLMEMPELDTATRLMLEQAGMDPDQIEKDLQEQKAENERALQMAALAAHEATTGEGDGS